MARGINKVILIGNAGDDAEVRYMPSGGAVANINIATSESWKDKQTGEMQERTEWHRVVFMDRGNYRLGQIAGDFIKKGSKVYVEGALRTREWEKDGVKRYTTEVVASEMQLLDSRGESQSSGQQPQQSGNSGQLPPQQPAAQPQRFGSFDTDWSGYKPSATTNGATIEQVKKKYNGDLQAAIKNGHVEVDDDSSIPF